MHAPKRTKTFSRSYAAVVENCEESMRTIVDAVNKLRDFIFSLVVIYKFKFIIKS